MDDALYAFVTAPDGGLLIAAIYDADGRLVSVWKKTIAASRSERYVKTGIIPVEGSTCKLMLVDANYAPLCAAWSSGEETE